MKKVGSFFLSFVPYLVIQAGGFLLSITVMGALYIFFLIFPGEGGRDVMSAYSGMMEVMSSQNGLMAVSIVSTLLVMPLLALWYRKAKNDDTGAFYIGDFNVLSFFALVIGTIALYVCVDVLAEFIAYMRPDWGQQMEDLQRMEGIVGNEFSVLTIVYTCIVGPVMEELVVRGLMLHYLKKALPAWLAILVQASFFAVIHVSFLMMCYTFIVGLIFGVIAHKTGSIVWTSLAHIILNTCGMTVSIVGVLGAIPSDISTFVIIIAVTIAVVITILCLYLFFRGVAIRHLEIEYLTEENEVLDLNE